MNLKADDETPDERLCRLAVCFAKKFARRWRLGPGRWRELVGACWQGLARMPAGLGGPAVERAAYRGVADYLREVAAGGWGDTRRLPRRARTIDEALSEAHGRPAAPGEYGELEPVARVGPDQFERVRELWAETAARRAGWTWRQRVWVYLMVVEGWDFADIAKAHGIDRSNISMAFARIGPPGAFRPLIRDRLSAARKAAGGRKESEG